MRNVNLLTDVIPTFVIEENLIEHNEISHGKCSTGFKTMAELIQKQQTNVDKLIRLAEENQIEISKLTTELESLRKEVRRDRMDDTFAGHEPFG